MNAPCSFKVCIDPRRLTRIDQPGSISVNDGWTLDRETRVNATINGQSVPIVTDVVHTHDQFGAIRDIRFPGTRSRQEYTDLDGRLFGIVADTTKGFGYSFDTNNRLTGLVNYANGDWSQTYGYDNLDRLTSATSPTLGNQSFAYDANSNRTSHTVNGATTVHSIRASSNRLTGLSGATTRSYTYKATGQVQSISLPPEPGRIFASGFEDSAPGSIAFTYDPHNRLSAINGGGINAAYKIAATDMRVEKTAGGKTTRFVYGLGGQLLYEKDLNPNRDTYHVYLHGQPIAMIRSNTVYTVLTDHLGRAEVLVNAAGTTVWRANLRAFDRQVITDQIGGYQLGFPGQYHDDETGYAYNIHRDYDPGTGRYLQSDPIGLNGGLNTYGYVGGNPVMRVDPLGLDVFVCSDPAFNGNMGPVRHYWIKTDTQESGMGTAAAGSNAGNQYDYVGSKVETVDHAKRSEGAKAKCEVVPGVDEKKVNELIKPGRSLGNFFPLANDCKAFAISVLLESGWKFPLFSPTSPRGNGN